jgi:hypothetical protein
LTEEIDQNVEVSTEDSGTLKALRAQIKNLEKELDARPAREELESQIRASLRREEDAAAQLIALGQPGGLARFALSEIGDAEVNEESVAAFLKGLGYDAKPVSEEIEQTPSPAQQLAEVTDLGRRVSTAANNAPAGVGERIRAANSVAELEAIMAEADLLSQ